MSLTDPRKIDDLVVERLAQGSLRTTALLSTLRESQPTMSKQGFYAALRRLRSSDTVVIFKKTVSLNTTWVQKMRSLVGIMEHTYEQGGETHDVLALRDKESVAYVFSSIRQLDNFWGHIQNIVVHALPASEAVYTYDPHYWFYVGRPDTEPAVVEEVIATGRQFLMTAGGSTPLDTALKPYLNTDERQYHMERLFEDETYYLVVIGDFIFESHFDPATAHYIEDIYQKHSTLSPAATAELQTIQERRVRTRLKISRNRLRARKLRARLAKNFYIKPSH